MWIKAYVIGSTGWPEGHLLYDAEGEMWIVLSSAAAFYRYKDGTAIVWPCGGSLLIDQKTIRIGNEHSVVVQLNA